MNDSPAIATILPTELNHFKGRYALWIGLTALLSGVLITFFNLWIMHLNGQFSSAIIGGALLTVMGILYLSRPYFSLAPNRLTTYNLLGKAVKRYSFESFGHLTIEKNVLYIESRHEIREKVNINRWRVKSADWEKLQLIARSSVMPPP